MHESSTTCMMHLSLSKSIITGIKEPRSHEDDTPRENLLMDDINQITLRSEFTLLNKRFSCSI